ncbi:hypothetical protein RhiirA5_433695 [Rhizophagus irregularis]|uniref:Uncharacterized protein n=1 Tax=Rhizophagus irregularis TaxID=588596 RepID=A0A2I1F642_9GLOM|nr:hypothetical protein RhiirA5_433695 [Rhizophagus irregularis]PKY29844.1 hypothetical protein RhiirB3_446638 [Rhizophagus irregularis]
MSFDFTLDSLPECSIMMNGLVVNEFGLYWNKLLISGDFREWTLNSKEPETIAGILPKHPQSQGLIERANSRCQGFSRTRVENNSRNWTLCLIYIFVINNTICQATRYEIVFGMHPLTIVQILKWGND